MDTAGVLQGAGIAESRAASDLKCKLSISSFLTLPYLHLCHEYYDFCVATANDVCMGRFVGGSFMLRFG